MAYRDHDDMDFIWIMAILAGALAGGFVSGLAGFGTGLTALVLWLQVLPPVTAATLVILCSVTAQIQSLPVIRHEIDIRQLWPFVLPGLLGVPMGAALLAHVDVGTLKFCVGLLLLAYTAQSLAGGTSRPVAWGGRAADAIVALGGGILGGLAGLSGPLPTLWANLRGWEKARKRSVIQAFNLAVLLLALAVHLARGYLTGETLTAFAIALPGTVTGAWLGARTYAQMSDARFTRIILILLALSGIALVAGNF